MESRNLKSGVGTIVLVVPGGHDRRVTDRETLSQSRPMWSPDGYSIAYLALRSGRSQVVVAGPAASSRPQAVSTSGLDVLAAAWGRKPARRPVRMAVGLSVRPHRSPDASLVATVWLLRGRVEGALQRLVPTVTSYAGGDPAASRTALREAEQMQAALTAIRPQTARGQRLRRYALVEAGDALRSAREWSKATAGGDAAAHLRRARAAFDEFRSAQGWTNGAVYSP